LRGVAFVDVAQERGLKYAWPEQPRPLRVIDAFGCGCAAFDGNNDGWQDVLLIGDPQPALFRNCGGGRFENATADSGLEAEQGNWKGCAIGDYDGDGWLDILITGYRRLALYRNRAGLRFEHVTAEAGLDTHNHGQWGSSAGFMDLDGDGWLDLVIVKFIEFGPESRQYCSHASGARMGCLPRLYPPERAEIWRNTGRGTFERVPGAMGMDQTHGVGLVLAFIDLDDDGRMDFYLGNDGVPADFLQNRGSMQFDNIADNCGLSLNRSALPIAAMGADWADFNRDGKLDLVVTDFQNNAFAVFQNMGEKTFLDASESTRIAAATRDRLGFGAKWTDFENDGWPDLFFVNGHVHDDPAVISGSNKELRQTIQLFQSDWGRKFADIVPALGADVRRTIVGRGSATADFDNDGRVDLLAVDYEGSVMLLENRTHSSNHWLKLDLRAAAPNQFAYGARVVGKSGFRIWLADVSPASSYLSSSDPRIHWGLGHFSRLDTLQIRWPSGREETHYNVAADQILRVDEQP
jgi:hypothetical protein